MAKYTSKFAAKEIDNRLSLVDKKIGASYFDPSTMICYHFKTEQDKDKWLDNRDGNLVIGHTPYTFTNILRQIIITNTQQTNNFYFVTTHTEAVIEMVFKSQEKSLTATSWDDKIEDFYVTVAVDKNSVGSYTTIVDSKQVINGNSFSVDVRKYLAIGNNRVRVTVVGAETGETKSVTYSVVLTSMYLTPANFAWNVPFIEGRPYNLGGVNIGGNLEKMLYVKMSNEHGYSKLYEVNLGATQWINSAYYFTGLEFPAGGTGVYNVELWLEADTLKSDVLKYNIMCVSEDEVTTAQLVAISNAPATVKNYSDNKLFDYVVYNGGMATASPSMLVKATVNNNPTVIVDDVLANVQTETINSYELNIEVESHEANLSMTADIALGDCEQRATYVVDNSLSFPAVSGATFYMNAAQRNNSQANKEKIINIVNGDEIDVEWTKMAWEDGVDGWTIDEAGRKCLLIPAHSKAVVNLYPLASVGTKGKTIEFAFKVRNVADYNEPIITIYGDNRGVCITPADIIVKTLNLKSLLTQSIGYKDEEFVHVLITFIYDYKVTYGNLCQIYVNGVKARSFEFKNDDNLSAPYKLELGNNSTDLCVYSTASYDVGFDKQQAETNFISRLASSLEKKNMYDAINSVRFIDAISNTATINYDAVRDKFNTMVIEMLNGAELPHYGLSKEYSAYCNVEFKFVNLPMEYKIKAWRFILLNVLIQGQGTTSMNYWLWNLRFRLDKSGNLIVIYPDNTEQIIL